MQIDIKAENRVGIAQQILSALAGLHLDLQAVEVVEHHVYIQVSDESLSILDELANAVGKVDGVQAVKRIDVMPRDRRRMQISALLTAIPDPVIAVDTNVDVLLFNEAAQHLIDKTKASHSTPSRAMQGLPLEEFVGNDDLSGALLATDFNLSNVDVTLGGAPYFLECRPIREVQDNGGDGAGRLIGGVLIYHSPSRIGARLSAIQGQRAAGFDAIIAIAEPMKALIKKAKRAAIVDAPLMVLGETGTGKELLARACHKASDRSGQSFLALNCAALPEGLAESELFGYAPGAFTSADRGGKPGLIEMAANGTLFLDEIGDMSVYLQTKLLRFLQDGTYRRVGGRQERKVDVRIICATHRDLEAMVKDGTFREDLFYRLNVIIVNLPPLRERAEDIPALAQDFIARAAAHIARDKGDVSPPRLSAEAAARLVAAPWPGNVRQLENAIFRAVSLCDKPFLEPADFDLEGVASENEGARSDGGPRSLDQAMSDYEAQILKRLYPEYPSSRKLAKRLGVSHTTIAQKLKAYRIVKSRS
jgi:transcriptional regulator of aroF, aroG, tyrA and aromatic amino acid transport